MEALAKHKEAVRAVLFVEEAEHEAFPAWKCGACDGLALRCDSCPVKKARLEQFAPLVDDEADDARMALNDARTYPKPHRRPKWWTYAWLQMVLTASVAEDEFDREKRHADALARRPASG